MKTCTVIFELFDTEHDDDTEKLTAPQLKQLRGQDCLISQRASALVMRDRRRKRTAMALRSRPPSPRILLGSVTLSSTSCLTYATELGFGVSFKD